MSSGLRRILTGPRHDSIRQSTRSQGFLPGMHAESVGCFIDVFDGSRNEMARIPCKSVASLDNCRASQFHGW
jgi:hypothetical protein